MGLVHPPAGTSSPACRTAAAPSCLACRPRDVSEVAGQHARDLTAVARRQYRKSGEVGR